MTARPTLALISDLYAAADWRGTGPHARLLREVAQRLEEMAAAIEALRDLASSRAEYEASPLTRHAGRYW